jgi:very-short-patch-repair endonuclease
VYAVGHTSPSAEATLAAALLWAGPGAMLSHGTGAWWLGLTDRRPKRIHLSTPRRLRSRRGITVHSRCGLERDWESGLPVAPVPHLLRQYATSATVDDVRYALAQADYQGSLNLDDVRAVCGHGRRGSRRLRAALAGHLPQLAVTRSQFERRLLYLCEKHHLPLPECDVHIEGLRVDAVWREQKLIVELDGKDGHSSWERIKRDHHRDLIHRAAGFITLRYVWEQFEDQGDLVAADIARTARRPAA